MSSFVSFSGTWLLIGEGPHIRKQKPKALNSIEDRWSALPPGLCSTHESSVKFDSTLTKMSRVRVESAVKSTDMSRVRVESRWSSFESELSYLDTAWVKVESKFFSRRKRQDLAVICNFTEKEPTYVHTATFDRPPPVNNFFPNQVKCDESWVRFDSTLTQMSESELSQVSKFGFWVESELSQVSKFGIWVESELSHLDCHMSQSRVSSKKMSRAQPWLSHWLFEHTALRQSDIMFRRFQHCQEHSFYFTTNWLIWHAVEKVRL